MYGFELPFVNGPAFPLFELSRLEESNTKFQMYHSVYYPFDAYIKAEDPKKYIVFANLWDSDGDIVGKDDCFVKGNALGLEQVDFSSSSVYTFSQCDDDNDEEMARMKRESVQDPNYDSSLQEFIINGNMTIRAGNDAGEHYEPYGSFKMDVGDRDGNQGFTIFDVPTEKHISLKNWESYRLPFTVRFQETEDFMSTYTSLITLHGNMYEADDNDDDLIANYEGEEISVLDISEGVHEFKYQPGNGDDYSVRIK